MRFFIQFWPILIPFLIFLIWLVFFRKRKDVEVIPPIRESRMLIWTLTSALIITVICLIIFVASSKDNTGQKYIAPTIKDGKIIPGHLEPAE